MCGFNYHVDCRTVELRSWCAFNMNEKKVGWRWIWSINANGWSHHIHFFLFFRNLSLSSIPLFSFLDLPHFLSQYLCISMLIRNWVNQEKNFIQISKTELILKRIFSDGPTIATLIKRTKNSLFVYFSISYLLCSFFTISFTVLVCPLTISYYIERALQVIIFWPFFSFLRLLFFYILILFMSPPICKEHLLELRCCFFGSIHSIYLWNYRDISMYFQFDCVTFGVPLKCWFKNRSYIKTTNVIELCPHRSVVCTCILSSEKSFSFFSFIVIIMEIWINYRGMMSSYICLCMNWTVNSSTGSYCLLFCASPRIKAKRSTKSMSIEWNNHTMKKKRKYKLNKSNNNNNNKHQSHRSLPSEKNEMSKRI